jgi:hypothetical protein
MKRSKLNCFRHPSSSKSDFLFGASVRRRGAATDGGRADGDSGCDVAVSAEHFAETGWATAEGVRFSFSWSTAESMVEFGDSRGKYGLNSWERTSFLEQEFCVLPREERGRGRLSDGEDVSKNEWDTTYTRIAS